MNLFSWIAHYATQRLLHRQCEKCGHSQVVRKEQARETVPCEQCGAPLPPRER